LSFEQVALSDVGDISMTLKALCVTLGLLGLLSGDAIASPFNEGDGRSNIKPEEAIELFVTCEASFPLLSLRWDDRDNAKAAEIASILF
jgi:hypothetical protein